MRQFTACKALLGLTCFFYLPFSYSQTLPSRNYSDHAQLINRKKEDESKMKHALTLLQKDSVICLEYLGGQTPLWPFAKKKWIDDNIGATDRKTMKMAYENYFVDSLNNYLYNNSTASTFENVSSQLGKNSFIGAEFLNFYFGIVRLGVGGYFQSSGDTASDNKSKASLQKLLTNGGNLSLNAVVPFLFTRSLNDKYHFGIFMFNSFSFSSSSKSFLDSTIGFTGQSGINFHADFASNKSEGGGARLSFDFPFSYNYGGKAILQKMGLPDFGIVQGKASLILNNILSFYLQYPIISSSSIINNNYRTLTGGIQFSPSQILKPAK